MKKADTLVERGASGLENLSRKAAAKGGFAAKFADELADDATFLRRLKPSLIKARAKGRTPIARAEDREPPSPAPSAPSAPQISSPRRKPKAKKRRGGGGPNPFVVAGAALVIGIAVAKVIDWRGHAHPRD